MSIAFRSLSYIYDAGAPYQHKAVDDVTLDIEEGKITAIIGETGSGKSTLVQHLNALLLPTEGHLEILDYKLSAGQKTKGLKMLRKEVGLVFQFSEYQLFEETVLKDVAFGPQNFGVSQEEAVKKAKEALKLVGISEKYYDVSPLEMSGGQKRRVAIAGILAIDPKVIVLDEPTAGLDPSGAKEIISLFVKLNREMKKTIIIVSHDNEMVYNYADNTVLMSKGKIVYNGDTIAFFNDEKMLNEHRILKPQLVTFKEMLRKNGFKINERSRTLPEVVEDIAGGIKR